MLNITNHQGNANHNHSEIPPHTGQNDYFQKDNTKQVLVKIWRKGNPKAWYSFPLFASREHPLALEIGKKNKKKK